MADRRTGRPDSVAVLMGGTSTEREISLLSGVRVVDALQRRGYSAAAHLYEGNLPEMVTSVSGADMVFLALHGGDGENGTVQLALEKGGLTFTGSGSSASSKAMDKHGSKLLMRQLDITTPEWALLALSESGGPLYAGDSPALAQLQQQHGLPMVIKPNSEGSTVGVTIAKSPLEVDMGLNLAREFDSRVMAEVYIPGRELTVTVLDGRPLPVVEIVPQHDYYDYESKYGDDMSDYFVPADLSLALAAGIQDAAARLHDALGCRHYSRTDFRLSADDRYFCLELNTLPGLTEHSLTPMAAAAVSIGFDQLIETVTLMAWRDGDPR